MTEITAERAPELGHKAAGELCRHCTSPGCSIYTTRPKLCRDFQCEWLKNDRLGDHWFPKTAGMILTFDDKLKVLFIVLDPAKPDQHRQQPYALDLARMAAWGKRSPEPFEIRIAEPPTP